METWHEHIEEINRLMEELEERARYVLTAIAELRRDRDDLAWLATGSRCEFQFSPYSVRFYRNDYGDITEFSVPQAYLLSDVKLNEYLEELRAWNAAEELAKQREERQRAERAEAKERELYERLKAKYDGHE